MPWFKVIARRGGQIELLSGPAADDVKLADHDRDLGEFHAENEPEAWRQLATANPSLDIDRKRLMVSVDADTALAEQKREFEENVLNEALDNIEIPDDTGDPQDEVEEEEEIEETDPHTGARKKAKKVKKVKKQGTGRQKRGTSKSKK